MAMNTYSAGRIAACSAASALIGTAVVVATQGGIGSKKDDMVYRHLYLFGAVYSSAICSFCIEVTYGFTCYRCCGEGWYYTAARR